MEASDADLIFFALRNNSRGLFIDSTHGHNANLIGQPELKHMTHPLAERSRILPGRVGATVRSRSYRSHVEHEATAHAGGALWSSDRSTTR